MGSNDMSLFHEVHRSVFLQVDLDSLLHNVTVLRNCCTNKNIGVIAVVKAGAYGHGSVKVAKHLKDNGVERLAVATVDEAIHLRRHHIIGPLHIFGNVQAWEMRSCLEYSLTPTVCTIQSVQGMRDAMDEIKMQEKSVSSLPRGCIHIKIDSGMSRNGCQPNDLPDLVNKCDALSVPVEGMLTHFADSWSDEEFTCKQMITFLQAIKPYRSRDNIKFHVANSGAILNGIGTDLDFIRPGITMYGLPPDESNEKFCDFGLRPIGSIKMVPTLVKKVPAGITVGYSMSYRIKEREGEWVATFPIGYADGVWRHLSSDDKEQSLGYVRREKTGELCPIVGRVSMDAITVKLPEEPDADTDEVFTLITADYNPHTSASGVARRIGTIAYEVMTRQSCRLPKVYIKSKGVGEEAATKEVEVVGALSSEAY